MCVSFFVDFAGYLRACVTLPVSCELCRVCMCGTRVQPCVACGLFRGREISRWIIGEFGNARNNRGAADHNPYRQLKMKCRVFDFENSRLYYRTPYSR